MVERKTEAAGIEPATTSSCSSGSGPLVGSSRTNSSRAVQRRLPLGRFTLMG